MAKKKNKKRNNPSNSHRSNDEMRISVSMRKKYGTMAETDKYSRGSSGVSGTSQKNDRGSI